MPSKSKPLPRRWFFTDARLGDDAVGIIRRLPRDAGVIVRVPDVARQADFAQTLIAAARRRKLTVLLAGPPGLALAWGADGAHLSEKAARCSHRRRPHRHFKLTTASHSLPALRRAERLGVDAAFLSPVFPTRSHPNAHTLGVKRFGLMTRGARVPVLALGGVSPRTLRQLAAMRVAGWGAIDAWTALRQPLLR